MDRSAGRNVLAAGESFTVAGRQLATLLARIRNPSVGPANAKITVVGKINVWEIPATQAALAAMVNGDSEFAIAKR